MSRFIDYPALFEGWLRDSSATKRKILHDGPETPRQDAAEVFTIVVPSSRLDQLYLIVSQQRSPGPV
jgi:hypothetical protein